MRHDGDDESGGGARLGNNATGGGGGRATSAPPAGGGRARSGTTRAAQLPFVAVELGYRQLLFPHLAPNERPPVVYFGIVERFTSLHQYRRRFLIVSATGTLYLCDPAKGNVTHTLSLRDGRTLELEADGANRASGMRAMALYRMGSAEDPLVLVFDCRDGDKCGPFFAVLRHFLGSRERLRVTISDDVIASMLAHPRRSLLSRIKERVINAGVASHSASDAALNGVRDTARTARGQRLRLTDPASSSSPPPQQPGLAAPSTTTHGPTRAAGPAAPARGESQSRGRDELRRRVELMYRAKCPERLPVMESALAKYAGHEEELLEAMVAKYGPEPAEPHATTAPSDAAPDSSSRGGGSTAQPTSRSAGRLLDGPVPASSVGRPRGNTGFDADLCAHIESPQRRAAAGQLSPAGTRRPRSSTTIAAPGGASRQLGGGFGTASRGLGCDDDDEVLLFGRDGAATAAGGSAAVSEEEAARLLAHHQSLADSCAALETECAAMEAEARATRAATAALTTEGGLGGHHGSERRLGEVTAQETALAVLVSGICGRRLREACHKAQRADRLAADAEEEAARERLADMLDSI